MGRTFRLLRPIALSTALNLLFCDASSWIFSRAARTQHRGLMHRMPQHVWTFTLEESAVPHMCQLDGCRWGAAHRRDASRIRISSQ